MNFYTYIRAYHIAKAAPDTAIFFFKDSPVISGFIKLF